MLIPAAQGLKLLDLCPAYDDASCDESASERHRHHSSRGGGGTHSFDSDSSEEGTNTQSTPYSTLRRKILRRRRVKRRSTDNPDRKGAASRGADDSGFGIDGDNSETDDDSAFEVQFEEPTWWQHLPSLKCIGLASLLVEEPKSHLDSAPNATVATTDKGPGFREADANCRDTSAAAAVKHAKSSLVQLVCSERRSNQLRALAQCIGFSEEENSFGPRGDLSPFQERLRLHVINSALFKERVELDSHERSSEQSRWW